MRSLLAIKLIAGSSIAWPLVARAQQPSKPVIGLLDSESPVRAARIRAFQQGLAETAYIDGRNVLIEYRWDARGAAPFAKLEMLTARAAACW
jgi:putative ABC transport system substrate-binding protein